jgi:hypothetical protein
MVICILQCCGISSLIEVILTSVTKLQIWVTSVYVQSLWMFSVYVVYVETWKRYSQYLFHV